MAMSNLKWPAWRGAVLQSVGMKRVGGMAAVLGKYTGHFTTLFSPTGCGMTLPRFAHFKSTGHDLRGGVEIMKPINGVSDARSARLAVFRRREEFRGCGDPEPR